MEDKWNINLYDYPITERDMMYSVNGILSDTFLIHAIVNKWDMAISDWREHIRKDIVDMLKNKIECTKLDDKKIDSDSPF